MTLKQLFETLYIYNDVAIDLTIDNGCDYMTYNDYFEICDELMKTYLGESIVEDFTIGKNNVEIKATAPEIDLGELEMTEREFDLIMKH